jgi:dTDP-4-dehydrorhamnose reductase
LRVAIVGAGGQLGAAVVQEFSRGHDVRAFPHHDLDVNDAAAVGAAMLECAPQVIVNCAAYNAVDAAEDAPVDALRTNALAVRTLARVARSSGAVLVHYGTDFVFDGSAAEPYTENDRPNPQSFYAMSKLVGEWFALDAPRSYVLRVESLFGEAPGGPPAKGSVAIIVGSLRSGRPTRVFEDRTVSPTYVFDAARATRELVERRAEPGLYHCVNAGRCTWVDFGQEVARLLGVPPRLEIVSLAAAKFRAPRPRYCALSNQKLVRAGIVMPPWQDALASYLGAAQ